MELRVILMDNVVKIDRNIWIKLVIPDHPYIILIIGGSGSGKTNALLNLINNQPDIDKIYLYAKIHMKKNINI